MRHLALVSPSELIALLVDEIVAMPKFVRRRPMIRSVNGSWRIDARTIYGEDSALLPLHLHIRVPQMGRAMKPAAILSWAGTWIRGFNWEVRRVFADGTEVAGWHEHLYDHELRKPREAGRALEPVPTVLDPRALFDFACDRWNIRVGNRTQLILVSGR